MDCLDEMETETEASQALVELRGVTLSYPGRRHQAANRVLDGVDLEVRRGEIVGLAGESGSGKSTIAKAILGLTPVERGEVVRRTRAVQMVFQDPYSALNPAKTVGWIMQEPLRMQTRLDAGEREARVREMLREVGLGDAYYARRPSELSGGQRQRVCIGAALMTEPELLIADEPVSALDVTVAAQVLALMRELHQKKSLSMLFISHDLRVMYYFCDRILILHEGRIIEAGAPQELYRHPQQAYTKLLLQSAGIADRT